MNPAITPDRRTRNRVSLSAYYFMVFSAVGFITPFLPIYLKSRSLTYTQIGVLLSLASGSGALTLIPCGALSDRLQSRRPFILLGALMVAVAYAAFPHLHAFAHLAIAQAVVGIGSTMSQSVAAALGADLFTRESAGQSFAFVRSWGTVGFLVVMAVTLSVSRSLEPAFFFPAAAVLHLLSAIAALTAVRGRRATTVRIVTARRVALLLANRQVATFVLAYFLFYMAIMCTSSNLSLYLNAMRPAPPRWVVPLAFTVSAAAELPFLFVMGRISDRVGRMPPLRIAFAVLPLRLVGYALAFTPSAAIALQLTHSLTFSVIAVVPFAYMTDITPPELRATGQAVLGAASAGAFALGPMLAGRIADVIGMRHLFGVLACVAALGTVVLYGWVREPQRAAPTPRTAPRTD